jgi:type III secretory pathway component EscT
MIEDGVTQVSSIKIIMSFALASARIYAFFATAPILSSSVLQQIVKVGLVFSLAAVVTPTVYQDFDKYTGGIFYLYFTKEIIIALIMSIFLWMPFYALEIAGSVQDTQSGQTLSEDYNPLSNSESTESAKLLSQILTCYLFSSGIFLYYLNFIYQSFIYIPIYSFENVGDIFRFDFFADTIYSVFLHALMFIVPFFIIYFAIDCMIIVLSKFSPQLNVLVYNSPIKSVTSLLIFSFYLDYLIPYVGLLYMDQANIGIEAIRSLTGNE